MWNGVSRPPRFRSQAFSTSQRFPSKLELRGFVSRRNRPWGFPFRGFPSQESRTPLEAAGSRAVIHRHAKTHPSEPYHRRFHRRPHPKARLPGSPDDYEVPFHAPRRASRSLRARASGIVLFRRLHPLRSVVPPASPFAPDRVAPNRRPILSWASASLERSPSTPRSLGPVHAPKDTDTVLTRRIGRATRRTSRPPAPGETSPNHKDRARPLDGFRSCGDRPEPPLDGSPTPMALGHRANPEPLTFEALKYVESGVSPQRSPTLTRFGASSTAS